jgi:hypothetical protein
VLPLLLDPQIGSILVLAGSARFGLRFGTISPHYTFFVPVPKYSVCKMSMRDQYRTRAAEFQARAAIECDAGARHEYENLARHYSSLAEQAGRNDFVDLSAGEQR